MAIKTELEAAGFTVLKEKQTTLTEERAKEFYRRCWEMHVVGTRFLNHPKSVPFRLPSFFLVSEVDHFG